MDPIEIKYVAAAIGGLSGTRQYYTKWGRYLCPQCGKQVWLKPSVACYLKSCGCGAIHRNRKHGLRGHPLYYIWQSMRRRCDLPTDAAFARYGGRGITVCAEWLDFQTYYNWAISNGWTRNITIERKDNNGPYSPTNCCMATSAEQAYNRCTNVITKEGVLALRQMVEGGVPIPQVAKKLGLRYKTAWEIAKYRRWKTL